MANLQFNLMQLVVVGGKALDSKPTTAAMEAGYKSSKYFHIEYRGAQVTSEEVAEQHGLKLPKSLQGLLGGLTSNTTLSRVYFENGTAFERTMYKAIAAALAHPACKTEEADSKDEAGNDIKKISIVLPMALPVASVIELLPNPVPQYHWDNTTNKLVPTMAFRKKDPLTGIFMPAKQLEATQVSIVVHTDEIQLVPVLLAKAKERIGVKVSDAELKATQAIIAAEEAKIEKPAATETE